MSEMTDVVMNTSSSPAIGAGAGPINSTPTGSLKRCTFAIISHPDAGKTTMTEKLLWFGGVIRQMGMVKSKTGQFATSDWMELEKQRGISITSSVMSFDYNNRALHLLDTPGHKDFSEDTYRTLTAVESVLMMIDSAKGVEAQTIKLMEVARMRDTPIVTFMNKYDRGALDPFELMDNVEKICSIQCCPMTWPIGQGVDFRGVLDLRTRQIVSFKGAKDPFSPAIFDASNLDSPTQELRDFLGEELLLKLQEDLVMISDLIAPFAEDEFLAGIQTPVFFGTALYNFGVKEALDFITASCPGPKEKEAKLFPFTEESPVRMVLASETNFSGFVFKIQANMDKNHRDRIAFLRVVSGMFERGDKIFHVRSGKEVKINTPLIFQSREREIVEQVLAGDIIGISGSFQIGDTFTRGEKLHFTGIPSFAPEIFMNVILKDPMKAKQLEKGLTQLSEEGAVQLFRSNVYRDKILGAVGSLQFDVVKFRLEDEYNVKGEYASAAFSGVRWLKFKNKKIEKDFLQEHNSNILFDVANRPCFGINDAWLFKLIVERNPEVSFYMNSECR